MKMGRWALYVSVWFGCAIWGAQAGTFMVTDTNDFEGIMRDFGWAAGKVNEAPDEMHTITFEEKTTPHTYVASGYYLQGYTTVVGSSPTGMCQLVCTSLRFVRGGSVVDAELRNVGALTNLQSITRCLITDNLAMGGWRVVAGISNCTLRGPMAGAVQVVDTVFSDCVFDQAKVYGTNITIRGSSVVTSIIEAVNADIHDSTVQGGQVHGATLLEGNAIDGSNIRGVDLRIVSNRLWGVLVSGSNIMVECNRVKAPAVLRGAHTNADAPRAISTHGISLATNSYGLAFEDAWNITIHRNRIGFESGQPPNAAQEYGLVLVGAQNVMIGGTNAADRNYIGGNKVAGIYGEFGTPWEGNGLNQNVTILNNYIGMDDDGTTPVANGYGIRFARNEFWNESLPTVVDCRIGAPGMANLISGNTQDGVSFRGCCSNVTLQANRIGLAAEGVVAAPNQRHGIYAEGYSLGNPAANMLIGADWGGINAQDGNIIAGNASNGVQFAGGTVYARVAGNWIGLAPDVGAPHGAAALPNGGWGVDLNGGQYNWIGLTGTFPNVISGNLRGGIRVGWAYYNTIWNNFIGAGPGGQGNFPNGGDGVCLDQGATYNIVGGALADAANFIGGNQGWGVNIPSLNGSSATRNNVYGNWIGLAPSGMTYSVNALGGAQIGGTLENRFGGAQVQEGNMVDGLIGVRMSGNAAMGLGCRNMADGNVIGFNPFSAFVSTTLVAGIEISDCLDNDIGAFRGNAIGGASYAGIHVVNLPAVRETAVGHYIRNNVIGCATNAAGVMITNQGYGLLLEYAGENVIGAQNTPNFIAGNRVGIGSFNSADCRFVGNLIGWDPGGRLVGNRAEGVYLEGDSNVVFGGSVQADYNAIGGSGSHALRLCALNGGQVLGNLIGLAPDGVAVATNLGHGVWVQSSTNVAIGQAFGQAPLIGGNAGDGLRIEGAPGAACLKAVVIGCMIGLDASGNAAVPNEGAGVRIVNAASNVIGVSLASLGNFVGGNRGSGVVIEGPLAQGNMVMGNLIGFTTNLAALGNQGHGIHITNAPGNIIGGLIISNGNAIGNSGGCGALVEGAFAIQNALMGNTIGATLSSGNHGNQQDGIRLANISAVNMVGFTNEGFGNLIVHNGSNGVAALDSSEFVVTGNRIGVDWTRTNALGNLGHGVCLQDARDAVVLNNDIGGNLGCGIFIGGAPSANNSIISNRVGTSGLDGLDLANQLDGVQLHGGDRNKIIGGNVIARNFGRGVAIYTGARNTVMGNQIYMNGWESIHVATNGIPPPNMGIRAPEVSVVFAGSTHIQGMLQGEPMSPYVLEAFYSWGTNDHGGFAQYPLNLRTNYIAFVGPGGVGAFNLVWERTAPVGSYVVVSATDTNSNTSQYSWPVQVVRAPDTQGHGVPDFYYQEQYTNLHYSSTNNAYNTDYDGDGMSDRDEWIAGTNPEDGDSDLRLELGSLDVPYTDPGRRYELERNTNLLNPVGWAAYGAAYGTGSNLVFDVLPMPDDTAACRIKVQAP